MGANTSFGERLRFLIDATGISTGKISDINGISKISINKYLHGQGNPVMETLVRLADYFAVPLDYLVGRCDIETVEAVEKDYAAHFMALRRKPYEMYLVGRDRVTGIPQNCEAPWPYNLLDDIGNPSISSEVKWEDRWQDVLSTDQEKGLEAALESLTEREHGCILAYYRDGLTLEDISEMYGVTKERIRQIIAKSVKKLRHPIRFNQIRFGLEGVKLESEYIRWEFELTQKKQRLDSLEAELSSREKVLLNRIDAMDAAAAIIGERSVEDMGLSVRSRNALKRGGCNTVGDVEALAKAGKLIGLRNMGLKSLEEVLCKLEVLTGKRYGTYFDKSKYNTDIMNDQSMMMHERAVICR